MSLAPQRARLATLALLVVASAVAARAETPAPWRVAGIEPAAPTWGEKVTVTVTGSVPTGCGGALSPPRIQGFGGGVFVDLVLSMFCALPVGTYYPFEAEVELGYLEPGLYRVRLLSDRDPLDVRAFEVYDIGTAAVDLPDLVTDAAPGVLALTLEGPPSSAELHVEGTVITVEAKRPPGPWLPLSTLQVPLPTLPPGQYEVRVFAPGIWVARSLVRRSLRVWSAGGCLPDERTLCLQDGRFRVTATWRDFSGGRGDAHPQPLAGNETSGLLWFFSPDNAEVQVKLLGACALGGHWWLFVSSGSTVEYEVTVTDTKTGATRRYGNELGRVPQLVADTGAFVCDGG